MLQIDLKLKQKKIFDLNSKCNINMFSTVIRGGKAFAAEQKIRELKKRIFRLKSLEKRSGKSKTRPLKSYEIIRKSINNMNSLRPTKSK